MQIAQLEEHRKNLLHFLPLPVSSSESTVARLGFSPGPERQSCTALFQLTASSASEDTRTTRKHLSPA
jgi:hypothetical protein